MAKLDWYAETKSLQHQIDQALTLPPDEQADSDDWDDDSNDDFDNIDDQENMQEWLDESQSPRTIPNSKGPWTWLSPNELLKKFIIVFVTQLFLAVLLYFIYSYKYRDPKFRAELKYIKRSQILPIILLCASMLFIIYVDKQKLVSRQTSLVIFTTACFLYHVLRDRLSLLGMLMFIFSIIYFELSVFVFWFMRNGHRCN